MAKQWKGVVITKSSPLNVRSGPSTSSPVIGTLAKGSAVTITEVTSIIAGCKWGKHTALGKTGYSCVWASNTGDLIRLTPEEVKPTTSSPNAKDEKPIADPPPETDWSIYQNGSNGVDQSGKSYETFSSSAVMYDTKRIPTTAQHSESVDSTVFKRGVIRTTGTQAVPVNNLDAPKYMQNSQKWPPVLGRDSKGRYIYDYTLKYEEFSKQLSNIDEYNNLSKRTVRSDYLAETQFYNRFKVANPNAVLSRSFGHVFFLRPDLNILKRSGTDWGLADGVSQNSEFYYVWKSNPAILKELVRDTYPQHDFMLSLSNAAKSFQLSDESVEADTTGQSYMGFKIPFSKSNASSKTNGTFDIEISDNRDLDMYRLLKLWTDYMSDVYRGKITPQDKYVFNRVFDYTTVAYYILCREDNETIIFWSKYYGVFPTAAPSSFASWTSGSMMNMPKYSVPFQYAWKEDFNPVSLVEFNQQSQAASRYYYKKAYNPQLYGVGSTWVGHPFIETVIDSTEGDYVFKLRFR